MAVVSKPYKSKLATTTPQDLVERIIMTIYAPPKEGKTWTAMSASKYWPKDAHKRTTKSKPIHLKDVVHIGWDHAAPIGLNPHNIIVDHYYDMPTIIAKFDNDFIKASQELSNDVRRLVYSNDDITTLIHDTMSAADNCSLGWYWSEKRCPKDKQSGQPITKQIWGQHLAWHREYFFEMTQLPPGVKTVFLSHEYMLEGDMEIQKASHKAKLEHRGRKLGDATVSVVPQITGSARKIYEQQVSLEMPLIRVRSQRKGQPDERWLYTVPYAGRRATNRLQHSLPDKIPADLQHLFKLLHA